ncbi:hypothetical protein QBC38DRAFT_515357 [Podospora fimiseda]|uniref:Uncharacterized protein n=1 Tax=Podospora fimiseda TaxID=252190 RepID=A0AAN7BJ76_9PEZI|nr:hypothetical protein QBC38DRAFT_515357 [Podospora fimiseda]
MPLYRTPLFPGDDTIDKCVYRYQGIVMTTNTSACRVILGLGTNRPPTGWKEATWLMRGLWFPPVPECFQKYDEWYSKYPSNQTFNASTEVPRYGLSALNAWFMDAKNLCRNIFGICTRENNQVQHQTEIPAIGKSKKDNIVSELPPRSVLHAYCAIFQNRNPDGSIDFSIGKPTIARHDVGWVNMVTVDVDQETKANMVVFVVGNDGVYRDSSTTYHPIMPVTSSTTTEVTAKETLQTTLDSRTRSNPDEIPSTAYLTAQTDYYISETETTKLESTKNPTSSPNPSANDSVSSKSLDTRSRSSTIEAQPKSTSEIEDTLQMSSDVRSCPTTQISATTTQSSSNSDHPLDHQTRPSSLAVARWQHNPSTLPIVYIGIPEIETVVSLLAVPAVMMPATVTTLTGPRGQPTATMTNYGGKLVYATTITTILTHDRDSLTQTIIYTIPTGTSILTTYFNPVDGLPTEIVTRFPVFPTIPGSTPSNIVLATSKTYFIIYFLPIVLTIILLLPIQAIDAEIKIFLPFRLLTLPRGTSDALTMRIGGLAGRYNGLKLLLFRHADPISLIADLMILCAAGLVSLSGETVGLKLRGTCLKKNLNTYIVTTAVFPQPARISQGLLGTLMILIVILGWILSKWKTGIAAHPSCIATVCSLMQVKGCGGLIQAAQIGLTEGYTEKKKKRKKRLDYKFGQRLQKIGFRLGRVEEGRRGEDYGVIGVKNGEEVEVQARVAVGTLVDGRREMPKKMLFEVPVKERVEQGIYLGFLCGLLTLILYYENTVFEDPRESGFEWFMDSQGFGVRMLFTSFVVLVSFMWDHLFSNFAKRDIYLRMAQRSQPAALSVLQPRATNVFTELWRSIRQRGSLAAAMAVAGILSRFLPLLLSSIPFAAAQTWITHEICTWMAVALLSIMISVLVSHIWLVKWPHMPAAAPDSLACCMYYRDRRVERMGRMYRFGWMTGVSGEKRVGIDYPEGEQGFKMKSLGGIGFGTAGRK